MNIRTPESLRLFFALWPDDATRTALRQLQSTMRGRLVHYDNLHLTLAFLGQQPSSLLPVLKDMLTHISPAALMLTLDRVGYFARNRIAWAGMHQTPDALRAIQKELTQALQRNGVDLRHEHDFKAHITLARDAVPPVDFTFTPIVWHAKEIVLVQSASEAGATRYEVLASRAIDVPHWTTDAAAGNAAPGTT